jgi:hypothetical protein
MFDLLEYKNDGEFVHSYLLWNREARNGIEVHWAGQNRLGQIPEVPQEELRALWNKANA